jgi:hypothetical protein
MAVWTRKASGLGHSWPKTRSGQPLSLVGKGRQGTPSQVLWTDLSPFHGSAEVNTMVSLRASHDTLQVLLAAKPYGEFVCCCIKDSGGTENTRRSDHTKPGKVFHGQISRRTSAHGGH